MARTPRRGRDQAAEARYVRRVAVKFHEHVRLPEKATEQDLERLQVGPMDRFREAFPRVELRPMYPQLGEERLRGLVEAVEDRDAEHRAAELFDWYVAEVPPELDAESVAEAISAWPGVRMAYVEPGPVPPPAVNPADDPRSPNQGYLDPAPDGIGAEFAWTIPGGAGGGLAVVDLEWGWNLDHEDLSAHGIGIISGLNHSYFSHGTSVLGEIAASDNTVGCVGITPEIASVRVVGQWLSGGGYSTSQPILDAMATMAFGDVLLLEAQTSLWGYVKVPVEIEPAVFDVIRLATALGIVVIEAAGNGGVDLDTVVNPSGEQIFNRASPDFLDSGAIIVGAGSAAAPHARLAFSCHGSRIDCYGWGESVDTCATDAAGTDDTAYTSWFNGTSSASPIVTGAALSVQGMAQASLGYRFDPWQLRAILGDPATGTASAAPATDRIGVMPNLRAIAQSVLAVAPDLYLRDHVGDTGDPHVGPISASPDVIVRPTPVADPQASFGQGSGTENSVTLGYEVEAGQDNYVYLRVLNRGGAAAANATATVYWSPAATLVTPDLWTLVGSNTLPSVPAGDVLTVSDAIVWQQADIPATGHYCFVALVGNAADPAPSPADFGSWDDFTRFIRENADVTWRNFNVVNNVPPAAGGAPPGFVALPFLVPGAPDRARPMALEVVARLPEGARLLLEAPRHWLDAARPRRVRPAEKDDRFGAALIAEDERRLERIILNPHGRWRLDERPFPARSRTQVRLLAHVPEQHRRNEYEVFARQTYRGREVGRVTWRLVPSDFREREREREKCLEATRRKRR